MNLDPNLIGCFQYVICCHYAQRFTLSYCITPWYIFCIQDIPTLIDHLKYLSFDILGKNISIKSFKTELSKGI